MSLLITGAGGLIGRAVVAEAGRRGWPVLVTDRRALACGANALVAAVAPPTAVIHLAAVVPDGVSVADDAANADVTRALDAAVIGAAANWGCPLVYASGCSLYTVGDGRFLVEEAPLNRAPASPYLAAKMAGDRAVQNLARGCVLRISAPVGRGLSSQAVLGRFAALAREDKTIEVFGAGTREQDYVDVRDLADLTLRAVERPSPGVYNASAAAPVTMRALAERVTALLGSGRVAGGERPDPAEGRPARYCNARAMATFGWTPRHSLDSAIIHAFGGAVA